MAPYITWTGTELLEQARYANGSFGDGVTMSADEVADDLIALNMLLASWDAQLYAHTQESKALTAGTASYTWGVGGNINTARPIELLDQTFIRVGSTDYPINKISQAEYNGISDKSTGGRPEYIFFDPQVSLAYIYLYPTPNSTDSIYLTSLKGITEITDATATLGVLPELAAALKWNLAVELAPNYGVPVTQIMMMRAQQTKSVVLNRAFKQKMFPVRFDNMTDQRSGWNNKGDTLGW